MAWTDLLVAGEQQYGVVARWQARGLGVSRAQVARRVRSRELEVVTPVVLRLRGAPVDERQRAMAAVLDAGPGAVLSHETAAAVWGLPGFDIRDVHVSRPRSGVRRGSLLPWIHQPSCLPPEHVTVLEHFPLTTPARTLFDLAGRVFPQRVERALENAWSKGLVDGTRLVAVLDVLGTRGRPGTRLMRALVAARGRDYVPPASGLEGRFRDILSRAGLPAMERQVDLGGGQWLGRVDFFDRETGIVVQIDSERYHAALIDKRADAAQTA
ncbi:MAG TPA: hypothetical protein VF152_03685, partial [Acidimicrobiia bacterium]